MNGDKLIIGGTMIPRIVVIEPGNIDEVWPTVLPHLQPAFDEDMFNDAERVKSMLLADNALLFVAICDDIVKGACVTSVENLKVNVVNILTLGGDDFHEWSQALNDALTLYAKTVGCSYIVALGRDAWQKLWSDFKPGKRFYSKEI